MAKSIKLKNDTYIDSSGVVHNRSLLSTLLEQYNSLLNKYNNKTPINGTTDNWVWWKFPDSKFFVAIIPQISLKYTNGAINIATPFIINDNKSAVVAMVRWNNTSDYMSGGTLSDQSIILQLGISSFTGTNMTSVILAGEYR